MSALKSCGQPHGGWVAENGHAESVFEPSHPVSGAVALFSELVSDRGEGETEPEWAAPDRHEEEMAASDRRRLLEMGCRHWPAQRVPLVLYHFEELSYEEIAERLGCRWRK
jgi:DNA-directed RNA polymerase specialized sigma24 family protein